MQTFKILSEYMPDLNIHEVPTGTKCFDWEVPEEWAITEAYIEGPDGKKIVDKTGNAVYTLHFESGHEIAQKNIDFQLNGVK